MNDLCICFRYYQFLLLFVLVSCLTALPALAQSTRYVSTTGITSNPLSATSWATSTTDLQGVVMASATNDQVWVAAGTYKPTPGSNRSMSFSMKNGVAIYGGFLGIETALNQRPTINLTTPSGTTLSGDVGIPDNPTDNSFHVINNPAGLTTTALLNGFVIFGGNTSGVFPDYYGGGMYNNGSGAGNSCSPTVINCLFINNSAAEGGALYNNGNAAGSSNAQLIDCVFRSNTATSFGGAVINDGGIGGTNSARFTNCLFQNNTAPTGSGGAVYNFGQNGSSTPRFINCSFLNNAAPNGGAIYNDGSSNGISNPQLTNCSFLNNTATTGGAIVNYTIGGGISNPQFTNCVLFSNGGANTIANTSATLTAQYSLFEPSVTGYVSGPGNLTTTISPFASATSTQLKNGSPPVNAGDPTITSATVGTLDLAGNPRFFANAGMPAGRIDMGAYELQEILEIYSLKNGDWNDNSVWSVERLPQLSERVRLNHLITIPANYPALGGTLIYNPASKLIYGSGGKLQMGQ